MKLLVSISFALFAISAVSILSTSYASQPLPSAARIVYLPPPRDMMPDTANTYYPPPPTDTDGLPDYYHTGGKKTFVFSPRNKEWAAYSAHGVKVAGGIANGGKPGYHTPAGKFRIIRKSGPEYVSSKYPRRSNGINGGAPMPYAMHFTSVGHAIHGSPQISTYNGSHGCIRVKTDAAQWLSQYFITPGTRVVVKPY